MTTRFDEKTSQREAELRERCEALRAELEQAREALRMLTAKAPFGAHHYELLADGRLVFRGANDAAARILGIDHAPLVGKTIEEAFPPLTATEIPAAYRRAAATGEAYQTEQVSYEDNRITGAFEVHAFQIAPSRMVALFRDITERRKAEEQTRHFTRVVEATPDLVLTSDPSGRIVYANAAVRRLLGWERDDLARVLRRVADVHPPSVLEEQLPRWTADVLAHGQWVGESVVRSASGEELPVSQVIVAHASADDPGKLELLSTIMRDLSERKRHEQELTLSEARLFALLGLSQLTHEPIAKLTEYALESAVSLTRSKLGYLAFLNEDESELTMYAWSRTAMDECATADRPLVYRVEETGLWGEAVRQRRPIITNEYALPNPWKKGYPEGHVGLSRHMNVPIFDGERVVIVAGVGNKEEPYDDMDVQQLVLLMDGMWRILKRKQAEEALREKTEELDRYFANSADLLCIADTDGYFRRLNPEWQRVLGYGLEELEGRRFLEFVHPDDVEATVAIISELAESKTVVDFVNRYRCKDGSYRQVEWRSYPQGKTIYAVARDVTARLRAEEERRKLETQLQQTQKLESLGVLAGGIAHDFNNLLVAILGHADLAQRELPATAPARESLGEIEVAALRAAELCRQLLAYSGKGRFVVQALDVNELIQEMTQMLSVSISKKVALRLQLGRSLPAIEADASQIRQVLMNLVINASEAIGDGAGSISIVTGTMDCDRAYLSSAFMDEKLDEGRYVYLEISDTGSGMSQETLGRIFDPFYTTKFTGRGLGLAAVLGIVRGHRGAIKVYSEVGSGTAFKLLLPAAEQPATPLTAERPGPAPWRGSGVILLVDDEPVVRNFTSRVLERLNFRVIVASDGEEAVKLFRVRHEEIVCVLLDLTMPRMDGEETFRELRRIKPDVRVLLSSGYNEQEVVQRFVGRGLAGFIQKPFQVATLEQKLREILE
jgi:PAS domain S-box-containing protein